MNFKALSILLILLAGCRLGPRYELPPLDIPEEWKYAEQTLPNIPCNCFWWEVFEDGILNELEAQAVANNPNLYVALERVAEARALAGVSRADHFPQLSLNPGYSNTATLFKLYGISGIPAITALGIKPIVRAHEMQYYLPLNLTYEIDLWGKLQGQFDSAVFNAQAKEEAFRTSLLTLTTDLAANYFNLRALDAEIQLLEETVALRQKSLDLTSSRYRAGLTNQIDVTRASLELSNVEAELQDTIRQRTLFENGIATLAGVPASLFNLAANPLHQPPPTIPSGIPSGILLQRPDIAELERNMASEHALIGVAYASYLPSLSLTGAIGYFSPTYKDFMTWFSRYWSFAGGSVQPVFDGWRISSNVAASWARFGEASASYQQQVLTAFQEVEDALSSIERREKQAQDLNHSAQFSTQTTHLTTRRYTSGLVNYLDVVDSERSELDAKRNLAILLGQRYISTIDLIKALGGSWVLPPDRMHD